jgi:hypothetical protein
MLDAVLASLSHNVDAESMGMYCIVSMFTTLIFDNARAFVCVCMYV